MTAQLDLIPDLPQMLPRVTEPIMRDALIEDGCWFWLKRAWGAGALIAWAMCNPSTADAAQDDPTLRRVMEFSAAWGFGSCVVINIIPFISSTPDEALAWARRAEWWMVQGGPPSQEWEQWQDNLLHCAQQIDAAESHVAAWGNEPGGLADRWRRDIAEACSPDEAELPPVEWLCLGTNVNGSPRHPLSRGKNRIPNDFKPIKWVSP